MPLLFSIIAGLGSFQVGYLGSFTSPALPAMETRHPKQPDHVFGCELFDENGICTSSSQGALYASLLNIGGIIGSLLGGVLVDRFGRRGLIWLTSFPCAALWAWTAACHSAEQLLVVRTLQGVCSAIFMMCVPLYIAEIAPVEIRGSLGTLNQVMLCVGLLVCDVLGAFLRTSMGGSDWRLLSIVGMGMSLALTLCGLFLPESPVFLVQSGKTEAAFKAIRRVRGSELDANAEMERMQQQQQQQQQNLQPLEEKSQEGRNRGGSSEGEGGGFTALCDPDLRVPLAISCTLMMLQQFSGINAVIFYAGTIFESAAIRNPNTPPMIMMTVQVVGTIGVSWLIDRAGRRVLLLGSSMGMCTASVGMGMFFYFEHVHGTSANWLALVSMLGYIASFAGGMGAIPWVLMAEIFPVRVRGAASSLTTLVMWICAFVVTLTFDTMNSTLSPQVLLHSIAPPC
jgi:SP family facilitated glucose transporter-like MFS transporter 8